MAALSARSPLGAILALASSAWAQVSGEGAPALLSSTGHRMLLAGEPELLLLAGDEEELGRWWSRGLGCEAGGACFRTCLGGCDYPDTQDGAEGSP